MVVVVAEEAVEGTALVHHQVTLQPGQPRREASSRPCNDKCNVSLGTLIHCACITSTQTQKVKGGMSDSLTHLKINFPQPIQD